MTRLIHAAGLAALLSVSLSAASGDMPDPKRTPGALRPGATRGAICDPHFTTKTIRPSSSFTTKLKKQQMAALGYTVKNPLPKVKTASGQGTRPDLTKCVARSGNPSCWEEDHLISLELGGAPKDPKNLWPEPWFGSEGAHKKDVLENTLHRLVCDGAVSLATAQHAIATDWQSAYERYVGK